MNQDAILKVKNLIPKHTDYIIGDDVTMGKGNFIFPGTIIVGKVKIGNNNIIGPYTTIGTPAQHIKFYNEGIENDDLCIKIGDGNIIREYTTIHSPTIRNTIIGNDCFLMSYAHVSHDTQIEDGVTLTNNTQIAGHSTIMKKATVGLNSSIHQYSVIGPYTMIGMGSIVTKDVPPFLQYKNFKCDKINRVGMIRNEFTEEDIKNVIEYYLNDVEPPSKIKKIIENFNKIRIPNRNLADIYI